jgi:DNA-binding protein H-NS
MSEALKALNNIRTLRAHARETDLATLEEMLEKLTAIVEDRREEESAIRKEQEERQAKLEAFRQKLLDDGIDPAELLAAVGSSQPKAKSTRTPRPAKYKYTDENGNEQTWTGQGRTLKAITAAIEAGKTLEDFAI